MEKSRLPRDAEVFIQAAQMPLDMIPYTRESVTEEWEIVSQSITVSGLSESQKEGALAAVRGAFEILLARLSVTVEA